jgi:hypothetical protein
VEQAAQQLSEFASQWAGRRSEADLSKYPILVTYADLSIGVDKGLYESLVLQRVSQVTFPFLVSQDSMLNLRAMSIPTFQVVLADSRTITHTFDQHAELRSPVPQKS